MVQKRVWRKGFSYVSTLRPLAVPGEPIRSSACFRTRKYIGRFTFNRRQSIKNPETGRRAYRWRPPEEWEIRQSEELRIIDNETWERARRRLRTRRHLFSSVRRGASHLLSGLLVCELCGGAFTIVRKDYYGCRNHSTVGICSNPVRIRRGTIEHLVWAPSPAT